MKTCTALVALVLATAVAGSATAASKKHVHHHATHVAKASTASTSDWPGNPYMDLQQQQVERFWHDAFDPYNATKK